MPNDKVTCTAKREGKRGAQLHIKAHTDGFGHFKAQLDYHCESEEMADAVMEALTSAQGVLDGQQVDLRDEESVAAYVDACGYVLHRLFAHIARAMG